jgi:hypothetical protein
MFFNVAGTGLLRQMLDSQSKYNISASTWSS